MFLKVIGKPFVTSNKLIKYDHLAVAVILEKYLFEKEIDLEELFLKHEMDKNSFKKTLLELQDNNLLKYETNKELFIITIGEENNIKYEFDFLEKIFGLTTEQAEQYKSLATINEVVHPEILQMHICNLVKKKALPKAIKKDISFKTKEEVQQFLKSAYVKDIFDSYQSSINCKNIEYIFNASMQNKLSKDVFNFIIDYTIKSNSYNVFNGEFFIKVFQTFNKTPNMTFNESLEKLQQKNHRYQEPDWEEMKTPENQKQDLTKEELEGLSKWKEQLAD